MLKRVRFHPANLVFFAPPAVCLASMLAFDFLAWEAVVVVSLVLFARWRGERLHWSAGPPRWCAPLRTVSRNLVLACILPGLLSIALRLAAIPWIPIPNPVVPDEFSHLFLAKTFLSGRLANPPHPLWQHFESIHILSLPTTFSSMYMGGQACFLAIGKLLTGSFFSGVLLATALFCIALTWFLRAYVPPGWALFGGVLAAVRFGAASYWNNSYWGGSIGALGGALVFGAYPRLTRSWKLGPAVAFAAGVILLANSRPYEGAGLSLFLSLAVVWELWKQRRTVRIPRLAYSAATVVILATSAGWAMTRQWKAVTGNALLMPYQLNQRIYGWPLTLAWLPVKSVEYRHPELRLYHDWEVQEHDMISKPLQIPLGLAVKYSFWWRFFLGISLSVTLLYGWEILSSRRARVVWIAGGFVALLVLTEQSGYPHYLSPAAPAIVLFIVQGIRRAAHLRWHGAAVGPIYVRTVIPVLLSLIAVRAVCLAPPRIPPSAGPNYVSWCCTAAWQVDRTSLVDRVGAYPGNHLVIVHSDIAAYDTSEWVYNEPSPDDAKIVWARDMGDEGNADLFHYYPDRSVWRVNIKDKHWELLGPVSASVIPHFATLSPHPQIPVHKSK